MKLARDFATRSAGCWAVLPLFAMWLASVVHADHYSGAPASVFEDQRLSVEAFVTCGPELHPILGLYEGTEQVCIEVFESCASRLHIDGLVGQASSDGTLEDEARLAHCVWADTDRFRLLHQDTVEADLARFLSGEWTFPGLVADRAEAEMNRLYPAAAEAVTVICNSRPEGIERDLCARNEWFGHASYLILRFPRQVGWER